MRKAPQNEEDNVFLIIGSPKRSFRPMYYSLLEAFAKKEELTFKFGPFDKLNKEIEALRPTQPVLYSEGYAVANVRVLTSGAMEFSYPFRIWIFLPSPLTDPTENKRAALEMFYPLRNRLIDHLSRSSSAPKPTFQVSDYGVINATDKQYAGINVSGTITFDPVKLCV